MYTCPKTCTLTLKFFIDRFHTDYRLSKLAISFFDQKKNKMADSIPVKKKGSAKGPPSFVTPEYIEKQRQKKLEKMGMKKNFRSSSRATIRRLL